MIMHHVIDMRINFFGLAVLPFFNKVYKNENLTSYKIFDNYSVILCNIKF